MAGDVRTGVREGEGTGMGMAGGKPCSAIVYPFGRCLAFSKSASRAHAIAGTRFEDVIRTLSASDFIVDEIGGRRVKVEGRKGE